jgi:hypothetical protein
MGLPPPPVSHHPVDVGTRSEAAVLSELVRRGYNVLLPFGFNQRYDFVLDLDGRFVRLQCKTGRLRKGCIEFSTQSVRSNMKGVMVRDYRGDIDMFVVFCEAISGVYAVPVEEVGHRQGRLRVDPTANGQAERVRWARDYELPA